MSDHEEDPIQDVEEDYSSDEDYEEPLDRKTALKACLRTALYHDGLARGLKEAVKALDRKDAHVCALSESCNEKGYTTLIHALCEENDIPLVMVEDSKTLGQWAGLCKYNDDGEAVKVVGCSCVVIRVWGEESEAKKFLQADIKNSK
jgi:small subunit ribosomal protein S12e